MSEYVSKLVAALQHSFGHATTPQRIALRVAHVHFAVGTAVPCGLIIHELVMNAMKHAFSRAPGEAESEIMVDLTEPAHDVTLTVADNGTGFSSAIDPSLEETLGLTLIRDLASQLQGGVRSSMPTGRGAP